MSKLLDVKIAVIGLGYVGLPLAVTFSKQYLVLGFDIDANRVEQLKAGKDITLEVPNSELDAAKNSVDMIIKNIDLLSERYELDSEDLSILGFSQGAILSWALGFYKPNKIRRIMPISGLLHESVITKNKPTFLAYASHGIEDNVIPIEKAREFIVPISNNNSGIHYKEFNDGHNISQENFSELLKWIEKTNL